MSDAPLWPIFLMALLASASFFFALAESALFSLGKWRVRQITQTLTPTSKIVERLFEKPQDLLAAILLGNTFANAGLIGIAFWLGLEGRWPITLALTGAFFLMLVGCEVVPKTVALRQSERWTLRLARPVSWLLRLSAPLRQGAQQINASILRALIPSLGQPRTGLTEAEYQELLEMAFQQGALARAEKEIILQIINLDQKTAREVMRPRSTMACVPDDLSIEEMVEVARQQKHHRLPIYDETTDTIVGVLDTRALLLDPARDLAEATEFPSFVPESMNLLKLLQSFQRQQRGLAVVLDEFGGTAGVVTMTDILEEVVGNLPPEVESQGFVMEKLGPGRWRVAGVMPIDDFRREYPALGPVVEIETMGGLLMAALGVAPRLGESITRDGLRLTASLVDERRALELVVEALKSS